MLCNLVGRTDVGAVVLGKAVIRITDVGAVVLGTDVLGADEQEQKCLALQEKGNKTNFIRTKTDHDEA